MAIYRLLLGDERGKFIGYEKLVQERSMSEAIRKAKHPYKSGYVGKGRKVIAIVPTSFKGTLKKRLKLPYSKRFGTMTESQKKKLMWVI